jgi:hypothetical protein
MFNATFNNISVIAWQSVLLVDESMFALYMFKGDRRGRDCMVVGFQLPVQSAPITTNIVSFLNDIL